MTTEPVAPERRLRIAVLGDFDGVHTRSWLRYFVERGHDVHAVSYYEPAEPIDGVTVHALRPGRATGGGAATSAGRRLPPGLQRIANLVRYRRAGLRRVVAAIAPDVLHAHFVVEHGFYGTAAAFRPYVVTAWGSDVLVEAARSPLNRAIARFALARADLATANNRHMAREMVLRLGIERGRVQHIVLGAERYFLGAPEASVNVNADDAPPTVISTRSLDKPLYNIDTVVRAMARVRERVPAARLVIAGGGRLRPQIESLVAELSVAGAVNFVGVLDREAFRDALAGAHVFVSVPSSDGTSVALLQAMAVGCLPIVSDLASQQELVEDGVRGLRVPVRDVDALAGAIERALEDHELRRAAVDLNRAFVEEYGVLETNLARMEGWYYRLAGRAGEFAPPAVGGPGL
jgi:glycosyltransferase involved in cell wall biosynthesis